MNACIQRKPVSIVQPHNILLYRLLLQRESVKDEICFVESHFQLFQSKRKSLLSTCPSDKHYIKFGCLKPKSSSCIHKTSVGKTTTVSATIFWRQNLIATELTIQVSGKLQGYWIHNVTEVNLSYEWQKWLTFLIIEMLGTFCKGYTQRNTQHQSPSYNTCMKGRVLDFGKCFWPFWDVFYDSGTTVLHFGTRFVPTSHSTFLHIAWCLLKITWSFMRTYTGKLRLLSICSEDTFLFTPGVILSFSLPTLGSEAGKYEKLILTTQRGPAQLVFC